MPFTEFCCRSGGSNLNAGSRTGDSTEPGTSASFTYASGSWVASTGVFTVASGNPLTDGVAVGDLASVYADGSTVTNYIARVTARDATTITISLTSKVGTAPTDGTSNRTVKIGGAWAGPSGSDTFPYTLSAGSGNIKTSGTAGCRINFKNDQTYSISAVTGAETNFIAYGAYQGYQTSFGDGGIATFDGGTNASASVRIDGPCLVADIKILSSATTGSSIGLDLRQLYGGTVDRVIVSGFQGHGIYTSYGGQMSRVLVDSCGKASASYYGINCASGAIHLFDAHIRSAATSGRTIVYCHPSSGMSMVNCRIEGGGTKVSTGFNGQGQLINCDFYNLDKAIYNYYPYCVLAANCNFGKLTTIAESGGSRSYFSLLNCGFGAGTFGYTNKTVGTLGRLYEAGSYNYAASPWVDVTNGDWRRSESVAEKSGYSDVFDPLSQLINKTGIARIGSYPAIGGAARMVNIRGGADQ